MSCTIEVVVTGDGCGIEVEGGVAYSVGNQFIDATANSENCECEFDLLVNDQTPPALVCDGDVINVTLEEPNSCGCEEPTVECKTVGTPLFVTSRLKNGKIRLSLSANPIYKKLKIARKIKSRRKMKMQQMQKTKEKEPEIKQNKMDKWRIGKFWTTSSKYIKPIYTESSETLTMFVLHKKQEVLDSIEYRNYLTKINLTDIIGNESLGIFKFFLSEKFKDIKTDYIGLSSGSWNSDFPSMLKLEELHFMEGRLHPSVVYATKIADKQWSKTNKTNYDEFGQYIEELSNFTQMPLVGSKSLWGNNFICHASIFKDLMGKWKIWYEHIDRKFNSNYDIDFNLVGEAITMHYFANRYDLIIRQIDQRSSHRLV